MRWLTRVSTRGRVTIPKEIREKLQLKQGDRVAFVRIGDDVYMQPVKNTLLDKMGTTPVDGPQDFEKIREETKKKRGEKRGR
jgi:AbrB family looped-hinge helix DNA binding protein